MELQMCLEKEHFSTSLNSLQYSYNYNDSLNMDTVQSISDSDMYEWDIDNEKELNGDLALIPELSDNSHESMSKITDSPPTIEFPRTMTDIPDFLGIDAINVIDEDFMSPLHDNLNFIPEGGNLDVFNFDLTEYLTGEEPKPIVKSETLSVPERKLRAGVKKIDLQAQKYIVDTDTDDDDYKKYINEEEIPTEATNAPPILEACDLFSLLEQFEATDLTELPENILADTANWDDSNGKPAIEQVMSENNFVDRSSVDLSEVVKSDEMKNKVITYKTDPDVYFKKEIKTEIEETVNVPLTQKTPVPHNPMTPEIKKIEQAAPTVANKKTITRENRNVQEISQQQTFSQTTNHTPNVPQNSTTPVVEESTQVQSRKVLNELPQDLISRIKSRKRKTISVIEPFPNKKRGGPKAQDTMQLAPSKVVKLDTLSNIQLDHDYCSRTNPELIAKKEQSSSTKEEDERAIMMKQPMVKTSDGKLMVSLLKVNTIHGNNLSQKKKLDIEEYKKRREGKLKLQGSQNNSASSSSCSSPVPEDENTRLLKHQEKLQKMAMELLNYRPKLERKEETPLPVVPPKELQIPSDMEKKTFVSIGVNTDFKICKNLDPVTPVQQLEEIKPLLARASNKINCNSLITSLIENIPKVINNTTDSRTNKGSLTVEHGEDKTIVYLPKDRIPIKTSTVEVQTNISLIQQTKEARYRRRRDSSSSSSSSASRNSKNSLQYNRRRNNSNCSCGSSRSSKSSYYTSSSRSRSPSRSPRSPAPSRYAKWEQERFREVEERRVVYVGRISTNTTREHLRQRFERFGPITNISLHFREHGYMDNYGFVTFANQYDAFEAIEHANDDPYYPKYDLSFGGRRQFCITSYSDLDNMRDDTTYYPAPSAQDSFDKLLREAQEKLRRRKF